MTSQELETATLYFSLNEDFSLDGAVFDSLEKALPIAKNKFKFLEGQARLDAMKEMFLRMRTIELTKASPKVLKLALDINDRLGRVNRLLSPEVVEWIENKLEAIQ